MKRLLHAGMFALATCVVAPAAFAQSCAGFTDVPDDGPTGFCPNVEWLKNRSITLGCTSTTLYCPNNEVTRLQMAAFMNRLGAALTPTFLRKRQSGQTLGGLNYSAVQTVCITDAPAFSVTGYPRTAILTALLNAFTPEAAFDLRARLVYSTDNGATWLPMPANDGLAYGALYQNVPGTTTLFAPPNDISLRPYSFMDLEVGSSYRFAVQGSRIDNGAGTAIAQTECELHVQIVNRNSPTPPRDEAPPEPQRGG